MERAGFAPTTPSSSSPSMETEIPSTAIEVEVDPVTALEPDSTRLQEEDIGRDMTQLTTLREELRQEEEMHQQKLEQHQEIKETNHLTELTHQKVELRNTDYVE